MLSALDILAVEVDWLLTMLVLVFKIVRDNFAYLELVLQILKALLVQTGFKLLAISCVIYRLVIHNLNLGA